MVCPACLQSRRAVLLSVSPPGMASPPINYSVGNLQNDWKKKKKKGKDPALRIFHWWYCRKIYHKGKLAFVRDELSVTKCSKNRGNEDKASLEKWKLKCFGSESGFINGLRGQFVFAEITVIFSCINSDAVHEVGMSTGGGCGAGPRAVQVPCGSEHCSALCWACQAQGNISLGPCVLWRAAACTPSQVCTLGCPPRTGAKRRAGLKMGS